VIPNTYAEGEAFTRARRQSTMGRDRLIVIGGNAAGMSAASQAARQRPELEIIALEQSPHTSYSA